MIREKPFSKDKPVSSPDGLTWMPRYALSELRKDVERELRTLSEAEREANHTEFAVFVVHNKLKPKIGELPPDIP